MIPRIYSYHYSRNLKIALIISLSLIILIFYFFPDFFNLKNKTSASQPIIFFSSDIPTTVQSEKPESRAFQRPPEPNISVKGELEPVEVLNDAFVKNNSLTLSSPDGTVPENKSDNLSLPPFVPRQILEVIPKKVEDNIKGIITLSLKIGKDGKVVSYIVLNNTTNCTECLKNVIAAIYKSKWEPASVNGNKIEYWIEKSYKFN